jgi:hypothetical protein
MSPLDVAPSPSSLDVEIQPEQRKSDGNWLRTFVGVLRRPRIDDVLMDKRSVAQAQRPRREFVPLFKFVSD